MYVVRGTHRCRPTDIYCGKCGVLTAFGAQHGPRKNYWLPQGQERCRTMGTLYPQTLETEVGRLKACRPAEAPALSVTDDTARIASSPWKTAAPAVPERITPAAPMTGSAQSADSPLCFFRQAFCLNTIRRKPTRHCATRRQKRRRSMPVQILIMPDGTTQLIQQEAQEWQSSAL